MFGDKQATIERFKEVYRTKLTDDVRARLVLENDEVRRLGNVHGFVIEVGATDVLQRR